MQAQPIEFLKLLSGEVQFVVPRWQRRYCWGQSDIERLVKDLLTVAEANPGAMHYGGTLLTFPEPGPAGVINTQRVVDGQQRLTTVSILLGCIANMVGPDWQYHDWTAESIRNLRLTNPVQSSDKRRKLKLQQGDEEEYRLGLEGTIEGAGAVAQAWRITQRLVSKYDAVMLLKGLERLKVVTIGLTGGEDPQQIFESLNATGRALKECDKVKNWLFLGLDEEVQQELDEYHWQPIENRLNAWKSTDLIDRFLRDFLRWKTGEIVGEKHTYETFRRWAVKHKHTENRPDLCRELSRISELYGYLTGTSGVHPNALVEQQLIHLRAMGIHTHRPLTLRLLNDASEGNDQIQRPSGEELAKVIAAIGSWITRLWFADRPTAGMNQRIVEFAAVDGPRSGEDYVEYWIDRIRRLRNSRVGVPDDDEVREGIKTRVAYGANATQSCFAVLCAMMEFDHQEEAPRRDPLTVEHVMPRKLTDDWKQALGEDEADEIHARYCNRLANLTLSGDVTNVKMGAGTFDKKRDIYRESTIGLTRKIADEKYWNEEALDRRNEYISQTALNLWPWNDSQRRRYEDRIKSNFQWRINQGPWYGDKSAAELVLSVVGKLLSMDRYNAEKLSGNSKKHLKLASDYPLGVKEKMYAIPGHDKYVMYPYDKNWNISVERCQKMGQKCGVKIEIKFNEFPLHILFWRFLMDKSPNIPGLTDNRGPYKQTSSLNSFGERIRIQMGTNWFSLRIVSPKTAMSMDRMVRAKGYSRAIIEQMKDQEVDGDIESCAEGGNSICIRKYWTLNNEDEWPDIAEWIGDQFERLRAILQNHYKD